jgi:hypothetical protein
METIEFAESYQYDTRLVGITVPAFLNYGGKIVEIKTKVDTGSSFCIFLKKARGKSRNRSRKRRICANQHGDKRF